MPKKGHVKGGQSKDYKPDTEIVTVELFSLPGAYCNKYSVSIGEMLRV